MQEWNGKILTLMQGRVVSVKHWPQKTLNRRRKSQKEYNCIFSPLSALNLRVSAAAASQWQSAAWLLWQHKEQINAYWKQNSAYRHNKMKNCILKMRFFGLMPFWAVYFLNISVIIFLILSFVFPRWAESKFLTRLKYPSSELVVFGISKYGYFSYVKRNGRFRTKLWYADLILRWVYRHLRVPSMYVFSSTNSWYFLYHSSNSFFKLSLVYFVIFKPIERSLWPASVSGLSVSFRLTTCIWWNWQIWTGISEKTLGMPRLPSNTTAVMMYPLDSRLCRKAE